MGEAESSKASGVRMEGRREKKKKGGRERTGGYHDGWRRDGDILKMIRDSARYGRRTPPGNVTIRAGGVWECIGKVPCC
eukprot:1948064-Pyramimonas_sp.AAC.1